MPTPSFPLGVLLAGDPRTNVLQVGLFTDPTLTVMGADNYSSLVELTTPGYQRSGPDDWEDAEVVTTGLVRRTSKPIRFTCTGNNPGVRAKGFFVVVNDGSGPQLIDAQMFETPRPMAAIGDDVQLQITVEVFDVAALN